MDYSVISATDENVTLVCQKLEERVKFCLRNGWRPQGGISVTIYSTIGLCYACQAMVKESKEEKN